MKPELARRMASSASGPGVERAPDSRDQRYDNAYLFGAICPARGVGAALALPYADTNMMQLHLDEISRNVAEGAHAVLLLDRAGWHTTGKLDVPKNITPIFLPSRAPELNPVENVWQYLRQNWLSNTVFENYDAILDAACDAWRRLIAQPERITSIGMRDRAHMRTRRGLRAGSGSATRLREPNGQSASHDPRNWRELRLPPNEGGVLPDLRQQAANRQLSGSCPNALSERRHGS